MNNVVQEGFFVPVYALIFVIIYDNNNPSFSEDTRLMVGWGIITFCLLILAITFAMLMGEQALLVYKFFKNCGKKKKLMNGSPKIRHPKLETGKGVEGNSQLLQKTSTLQVEDLDANERQNSSTEILRAENILPTLQKPGKSKTKKTKGLKAKTNIKPSKKAKPWTKNNRVSEILEYKASPEKSILQNRVQFDESSGLDFNTNDATDSRFDKNVDNWLPNIKKARANLKKK